MKQIIFFTYIILISAAAKSQNVDCSKVKTGVYKSVINVEGEEFVTIIYREKDKQIEENLKMGLKIEFVAKWTSKCTYELSKPKVVKGEMPGISADHVLYVKIIDVTKQSYKAEVSSNFSDDKAEFYFSILNKDQISQL